MGASAVGAPIFEQYHMSTMPQVTGLNQEGHRMLNMPQSCVVGRRHSGRGWPPGGTRGAVESLQRVSCRAGSAKVQVGEHGAPHCSS